MILMKWKPNLHADGASAPWWKSMLVRRRVCDVWPLFSFLLIFLCGFFSFNFSIIIPFLSKVYWCTLFRVAKWLWVFACICVRICAHSRAHSYLQYPLCCNNDAYKFCKYANTHIDRLRTWCTLVQISNGISLAYFFSVVLYSFIWWWCKSEVESLNTLSSIMGSVYLYVQSLSLPLSLSFGSLFIFQL